MLRELLERFDHQEREHQRRERLLTTLNKSVTELSARLARVEQPGGVYHRLGAIENHLGKIDESLSALQKETSEARETTDARLRNLAEHLTLVDIRAQAALDRSSSSANGGIRYGSFSLDDVATVGSRDSVRRRRPFL